MEVQEAHCLLLSNLRSLFKVFASFFSDIMVIFQKQPKVALKNLGGNIRETLSFGWQKIVKCTNLEVKKNQKNDPEIIDTSSILVLTTQSFKHT